MEWVKGYHGLTMARKFLFNSILYLAGYGCLLYLLQRSLFLALPVLWLGDQWSLVHTVITVFTVLVALGGALNLFIRREQAFVYTMYLGPVLILGAVFDVLHFLSATSLPGQFPPLMLGPETNLWFWLAGGCLFTLGLSVNVLMAGLNPRVSPASRFQQMAVLAVGTILVVAGMVTFHRLPSLTANHLPAWAKFFMVVFPLILVILSAAWLSAQRFLGAKSYLEIRVKHNEKKMFLAGLHFLILSHIFFLPSNATRDWFSLIGHLSKLAAFGYFMLSLWAAVIIRSYRYIRNTLAMTVESLVEAVDIHESSTSGHSRRVAAYAGLIGQAYGLTPFNLECLWFAAILHDVGKLSLSQEVLKKEGPLNESEWEEMHKHPIFGAQIINPLNLPWCEKAVLQHHERPDGKGYPKGIQGQDAIDLFAKIIAIADTFDAITSHRHYREARCPEEAKKIIITESGAQFDSECVEAFLKVFNDVEQICFINEEPPPAGRFKQLKRFEA